MGTAWACRRKRCARVITLVAMTFVIACWVASGNARAADPVSGDPVIVAAGDIACSPNDPHFNGGAGAPSSCQQRSTSDIFVS